MSSRGRSPTTSSWNDSGEVPVSPLHPVRRIRSLALLALSLFAAGGFAWWFSRGRDDPPFTVERYLLPQAPIKEVSTRPPSADGALLPPADQILGVTLGRESR